MNGPQHDDTAPDAGDWVAREMAATALAAWANLTAVMVETMVMADLPRPMIADLLDRLQAANDALIPSISGRQKTKLHVQQIREIFLPEQPPASTRKKAPRGKR